MERCSSHSPRNWHIRVETLVDIVQMFWRFTVLPLINLALLQKQCHTFRWCSKPADIVLHPGRAPVALLEALKAFQVRYTSQMGNPGCVAEASGPISYVSPF